MRIRLLFLSMGRSRHFSCSCIAFHEENTEGGEETVTSSLVTFPQISWKYCVEGAVLLPYSHHSSVSPLRWPYSRLFFPRLYFEYFLPIHCKENTIYVFLFWELRGLSPNFHIPVSVRDLYISRIGPHHIFLCSRIGRPILEIYKSPTDLWV